MSAYKIVQKLPSLNIAPSGGISTSAPFSLLSGYIRITPEKSAFVEISNTPGISTSSAFWIAANDSVVLKERVLSQPIVGITTGTSTTVTIQSGNTSVFDVGDFVQLSGLFPVGLNTNYTQVTAVSTKTSFDGDFGTTITLGNWNTSTVGIPTGASGTLRKAMKITAQDSYNGSNVIHLTEVQVVSNFS